MENKTDRDKMVGRLVMLLNQKGYRGKFSFGRRSLPMATDIRGCLDYFFGKYDKGEYPQREFDLEMVAPYDNQIICRFHLRYDEKIGFGIETFTVCNFKRNESKLFRLRTNNELPGSQTIYTLFPKPKPWDNIMKGKFRL